MSFTVPIRLRESDAEMLRLKRVAGFDPNEYLRVHMANLSSAGVGIKVGVAFGVAEGHLMEEAALWGAVIAACTRQVVEHLINSTDNAEERCRVTMIFQETFVSKLVDGPNIEGPSRELRIEPEDGPS